jgi:hypothetical protein
MDLKKPVGRPTCLHPKVPELCGSCLLIRNKATISESFHKSQVCTKDNTSLIVRKLEELHLIDRDDKGALRPSNPDEFLEA